MENRGWIFRTPETRECPRCHQYKFYFLVGGNLTTDYQIISCSDCYWQECVNENQKRKKERGR